MFFVGGDGTSNLINWQSKRSARITRSTLCAKTLSAMEATEAATLLSSQIAEIMGLPPVPIIVVTDNESLVNATRSTTSVAEKRLRVDISALREMRTRGEIKDIMSNVSP